METTYINNKTFKSFKNWVKELSKHFFDADGTMHAVYSAYYIFRHHLKDQEINDFLDKDFNSSLISFYRRGGIYVSYFNLQEISKKMNIDFDVKVNNNLYDTWMIKDNMTVGHMKECRQIWHKHVKAIYDFWRKKELAEIAFKRPSYNAFKNRTSNLKMDNLSDSDYIIWYCIKHNLSIEEAEEYIKETLAKRTKPYKMRVNIISSDIDAYYFKDLLKIDNSLFDIDEHTQYPDEYEFTEDPDYPGVIMPRYHRYNGYQKIKCVNYHTKMNRFNAGYTLEDLYINDLSNVNDVTMKMFEYYGKYKNAVYKNSGILFNIAKPCNYTEYACKFEDYTKLPNGHYITKKNSDAFIDPVEPIRILINYHPFINIACVDNDFGKLKEIYFNALMFMFLLFKSLDYIDYGKNNVSYEEYSKPIYKNEGK